MLKIKCCNVACKHNTGKVDFNNFTDGDKFGDCIFDGEIALIPYQCEECGNDDGIECGNFEFKNHN